MGGAIVRCERVGKRYRIGRRERYRTLRDTLAAAVRASFPLPRRGRSPAEQTDTIWSLRDVTFDVGEGEVVGVIGRNGAGKSTLLRVLAGITEPTEGRSAVRGRVGSLLEVGTGFHPELTGRDNVYLSGAILGLSRNEIRRRFDQIVAYAGVESFLDTPVKRYSSGMQLRLAFSVAAHLQTEILLVDEVLAVGDASFQRKCLETMGELANRSRTVLFVSHDLGAIQRVCSRALLLDEGRIAAAGRTADVVADYLSSTIPGSSPHNEIDVQGASRRGTGEARFTSLSYCSPDEALQGHPFTQGPLDVTVAIEAIAPLRAGCVELFVRDHRGVKLIDADSALLGKSFAIPAGRSIVRFHIRRLPLNPGSYHLGLWLARNAQEGIGIDHVDPAAQIEVLALDNSRLVGYSPAYGPVAMEFDVTLESGAGDV